MSETTTLTFRFSGTDKTTAKHRVEIKQGDGSYIVAGETEKDTLTVAGLPKGTAISYRITPISSNKVEGTATTSTVTTTSSSTTTTPPDVTGLELAGQKDGLEWYGRDVLIRWAAVHSTATASSSTNAGVFPEDSILGYVVKVYDGTTGAYRRTFYPPSNAFRYSYDDNYTDGLSRSLTFKVYARTKDSVSTKPATITVSNPVPEAIIIRRAIKIGIPIALVLSKSEEPDVNEYRIYGSQSSGFTPSDENEIYRGPANFFLWQAAAAGPWYFKACARDSFGEGEWNYSVEVMNELSSAAISTPLVFVDELGQYVGNIGTEYRAGVDNALAYFGNDAYADGHGVKGEVNSATYAGIAGSNWGSGPGVKGYSTSGAGVESTNYFRAAGSDGVSGSFTASGGTKTITVTGGIITAIV